MSVGKVYDNNLILLLLIQIYHISNSNKFRQLNQAIEKLELLLNYGARIYFDYKICEFVDDDHPIYLYHKKRRPLYFDFDD